MFKTEAAILHIDSYQHQIKCIFIVMQLALHEKVAWFYTQILDFNHNMT